MNWFSNGAWKLSSKDIDPDGSKYSACAVGETLIALAVGIILSSLEMYWMLWTSIFLTPFVHLRSDESITLGVHQLNGYWGQKHAATKVQLAIVLALLTSLMFSPLLNRAAFNLWVTSLDDAGILILVLQGIAIMAIPTIVCALVIAPSASVGRAAIVTNILFSGALVIWTSLTGTKLTLVALLLAVPMTHVALLLASRMVSGRFSSRLSLIIVLYTTPMALLGLLIRVSWIRFTATMRHLRKGFLCITDNWVNLVARTDIFTPPEIVPGLPKDHPLTPANWSKRTRIGNDVTIRTVAFIMRAMYVPSLFYRLVLKSSILFYIPLFWIAFRPKQLKHDQNGETVWDPTLGRSPTDIVALVTSVAGVCLLFYRAWDQTGYSAAIEWADGVGAPSYWPLLASGISPSQVTKWHFLPGAAALLSLAVIFWSWNISFRVEKRSGAAKGWEVWTIVKVNTIKNLLSGVTIIVGIVVTWAYLAEPCELHPYVSWLLDAIFDKSCIASGEAGIDRLAEPPSN